MAPTSHRWQDAAGFVRWIAEDEHSQSLWRPLLLRRLKAEHLTLPPKREVVLSVPLTSMQRQWYRALLLRNRASLGSANARSLVK